MSKKQSLSNHTVEDLHALVRGKRDELQGLRFSVAGSKNRNVKQARTLRKDIARALTQLSTRK